MGLIHIVLFKLKPTFSVQTFEQVSSSLNKMSSHIPQVKHSSFGKNLTQRGKGYTHAVVVELGSMDDLPIYIDHPHHQAILKDLKEVMIIEESIAVDYETS
ncbi:hypothetical protein DSO57_1034964 [Entomophthora muscae]|uniref:Uncharacterized protein n=1 Tax=Entomophthora muscae TaxID=34485 RepID=A0ACC2TY70_9FUNG|nr:hypothetical protein DSO57_1034964 [Entomophthora muscae]